MNNCKLFPDNKFPKEQILALNALIKLNNDYNKRIADGDSKFAQNKYNDALFDYYEAKKLKAGATYPKEKIKEIDGILALQNANENAYQAELRKADSLFNAKMWEEAIAQYTKVKDQSLRIQFH